MEKSNLHKKIYEKDGWAKLYCKHAHLNQVRSDRHFAKKKERAYGKKELSEQCKEIPKHVD